MYLTITYMHLTTCLLPDEAIVLVSCCRQCTDTCELLAPKEQTLGFQWHHCAGVGGGTSWCQWWHLQTGKSRVCRRRLVPPYFWKFYLISHVRLFVTPWTKARQVPLSMGILQARMLEWVAIFFSRGSSAPRDQTWVSCIAGRCFPIWATRRWSYL